ncbi:MAG: site-specific integrase [Verrucomicrobia bacterium]|nr:site-specific integrase [Verrucomicrobiota bacterium]
MASLYKQKKSSYWWIKFRDSKTGKTTRKSTKLRIGIRSAYRAAQELVANYTLKERQTWVGADSSWQTWVPDYIEQIHATSPGTLGRYRRAWGMLLDYLTELEIKNPRMLTRAACIGYVSWRKKRGSLRGKSKPVSTNTALVELRILSSFVNEAVRREYIPANPVTRLGIKGAQVIEKSEMSDHHITVIREEISRRLANARTPQEAAGAHFLNVSFEFALHQGCRMSETFLPLADIDITAMTIRFGNPKGGQAYTTALNPALVPMITELRKHGRTTTYDRPANPSLCWWNFFDTIRGQHAGFDRVSFHSTRVTCISRLERAGAPEVVVCRLVNHASSAIHRIYRRTTTAELQSYWTAAAYPPPSEGKL